MMKNQGEKELTNHQELAKNRKNTMLMKSLTAAMRKVYGSKGLKLNSISNYVLKG